MSMVTIIKRLDQILQPLGFSRHKSTWNRRVNCFVDVIDVQADKAREAYTVDVGVAHSQVHSICWGQAMPEFVAEPMCIVRLRLGELVNGKDAWWPMSTSAAADEVAMHVSNAAVPFLDRMHSLDALDEFLVDAGVMNHGYPLPVIYVAILRYLRGESSSACDILAGLGERAPQAWSSRVAGIARTLSC